MRKLIMPTVFLGLLFIFSNCKKDECGGFVPGEVLISVHDTITSQNVYQLIEDSIGLKVKIAYGGVYNLYLIEVPVQREQYWVDELKNYSIIKSSQLNHYSCLN